MVVKKTRGGSNTGEGAGNGQRQEKNRTAIACK